MILACPTESWYTDSMSLEAKTVSETIEMLEAEADELTDENYHSEAEGLWAQAEALRAAANAGYELGYFSWHRGDGGVNAVIVVRDI